MEHPVEETHQTGGPIHHGGVHDLALTGGARRQQGTHDAKGQVHATAAEVADQVERRDGSGVIATYVGQCTSQGYVVDVVSCSLGVGPILAPTGHPSVHDGRVAGHAVLGAKAQPFGYTRPEALEHHVRVGHHSQHQITALIGLEINADAASTPGIDVGRRVGRVATADRSSPVNPNDVGAHVGQHHPAEGSRPDASQFDDPDPVQCSHVVILLPVDGSFSSFSGSDCQPVPKPGPQHGSALRWPGPGSATLQVPYRGPSRPAARTSPPG